MAGILFCLDALAAGDTEKSEKPGCLDEPAAPSLQKQILEVGCLKT